MQTGKDRLPEERRSAVRHPHTCAVSFTALGNSHNLPANIEKIAETIDISNDGMRIQLSSPSLREGSMIKVRIPVTGSKDAIPVLAEVMWVKERKPENYYAGLRFIVS